VGVANSSVSGVGWAVRCVGGKRVAAFNTQVLPMVADEDPYAKISALWPLIAKGSVDVFEPFPFGEDQRGRLVQMQRLRHKPMLHRHDHLDHTRHTSSRLSVPQIRLHRGPCREDTPSC